jgi:CDP-glucose 4,6-dehydratase
VLWLRRLGAEVTGFAGAPPSDPSLFELARIGELADDVRGDVRDAAAVRDAVARARPDVVFHLAAQALVRRGLRDPAGTFGVNVLGTAHVLDAIRAAGGVAAVVVVTSDKCYAPGERRHREEDPLGGRDPYSSSKAAQEHVAAAYREAYGLPVATARAGNVIGGGDFGADRLLPDLVRAAASGRPAAIRNPAFVRPWQHVLNPLDGYVRLAERLLAGDGGEAWNFGPDAAGERPVAWVAERFRECWGAELRVETAGAGDGGAREAPALRLDSAKARERLGWAPRWPLETGLRATAEWHRAHRAGEDLQRLALDQIERYETGRE